MEKVIKALWVVYAVSRLVQSIAADPGVHTMEYSPARVAAYADHYRIHRVSRVKKRYIGYAVSLSLLAGWCMLYPKLFRNVGDCQPSLSDIAPLPARPLATRILYALGRLGWDMVLFIARHTCIELCAVPLATFIMSPLESMMRTDHIILRQGCWFIEEQIPDTRLPHAVVGYDLYDLRELLVHVDTCMQQMRATVHSTDSCHRRRAINQQSLVLFDLVEQIQGAIDSLDHVIVDSERAVWQTYHTIGLRLMTGIQQYYDAVMEHLDADPETWQVAVHGAVAAWYISYTTLIRPLRQLSCYRVRPWPLLEGTMNIARALAVHAVVAS